MNRNPATPPESFTEEESDVLRRYFTNTDKPVFALKNLPEVVKGALFARYSRSPSGLRRLFLDEFYEDLDDSAGEAAAAAGEDGTRRADALYDRVFYEYGDDSVAQLGGAHLACEQSSNLLTKVLEWGRLMSYLEQSTRYIAYNRRLGGRYRYYRPEGLLGTPIGERYTSDMDRLFGAYASLFAGMEQFFGGGYENGETDPARRRAVKARALDAVRGVLPAASLSNVGIYGSGQAYESLLLRMLAHPLPEARACADLMLAELRQVIPSFLKRVDAPDRGGLTAQYLTSARAGIEAAADMVFRQRLGDETTAEDVVELADFDPDGEVKTIAAMLYPHTSLPDRAVEARVRDMTHEERIEVARAYCGNRLNRRHRPGRALERTSYRFDVLSDYGAFRDLQRHRMLTIEWQPLSTRHGYNTPPEIDAAGAGGAFGEAMGVSSSLYEALLAEAPEQAPYAVSFAYRVRYAMQMNAREAMHMLELRTTPQGHPAYRRLCQRMHRLIAEEAGHRAIAEMMRFVDHGDGPMLGRLEAERRTEQQTARQRAG